MFNIEISLLVAEKPRYEAFKQDDIININTYYLAVNTRQRIPKMHVLYGAESWKTLRVVT